ncbi:site-specific DNA-methyltransferase [Streptomyces xiamenensis]|uniref:site-specific DNA-methyltransferase n=1 Tax=Streptomyces xiamenensis TaxID=408015 RepID=UPI003D704458
MKQGTIRVTMHTVEPGDPETHSKDLVSENLEQLRKIFPSAFTEGKVDFDALRELLGDAVDDSDEKFGLTWFGKRDARRIALKPSTATLLPRPEESVDWDTTQNVMIEGDNLEVLKLMQKSYANKVKLIYIDPPYNTGKDFIYPDKFQDTIQNYLQQTGQAGSDGGRLSSNSETSGRYHSAWLDMMYPRLMLARNLLNKDGVLVISIDEREYANLRAMCAEIYGEENLVGTVVWKNATDNNPSRIATEHEYLLFVARDSGSLEKVWKSSISDVRDAVVKAGERIIEESSDFTEMRERYSRWFRENKGEMWPLDRYKYIDEGGVYTGSQSVHNPGKEGYRYDVLHPQTGKPCKQPLMGYRFPEATMQRLLEDGRILFGEDEDKIIELKVYASEYQEKLSSVLELDGRLGAYELKDDFSDFGKVFSNPKPVRLLLNFFPHILKEDGDILLDFFAGSGSSARAIQELNSRDAVRRRFILVQLPEKLDSKVAEGREALKVCRQSGRREVISSVTVERIRRGAIKDSGGLGDSGTRIFSLADSGMLRWDTSRQDVEQQALDLIDNVREGREEEDILFELLLNQGLDLASKVEARDFAGKRVYSTGAGLLFACLPSAGSITKGNAEEIAKGIVDWRDELEPDGDVTAFFKDVAFADDVAKANLIAILDQHVPSFVVKSI